ncbi:MAG: ComEA family DNA-binding protein [Candidatus Omnitrophota bacterium]
MDLTKQEKKFLIFLSLLFLAGALILYGKRTRLRPRIMIIKEGVKEQHTLREVEGRLKEARRVNVNTASAEELKAIPGIGEKSAAKIIEYRDAHGGFEVESDLLNVKGMGKKKLEKIREYIKFE